MLYTPIKSVSKLYNQLQDAVAASERIFFILNRETDIKDGKQTINEEIKNINFEDVSLKYDNKDALHNISFEAKKGEKIALVGNSGGGKSSIVNLLLRFYDTSDGKVLFNNTEIKKLTLQSLRENISIVTQRVYIMNDSVAKNVAYGLEINK